MKSKIIKQEKARLSLNEISTYEIPSWQRWKNPRNVDSLVESVSEIGQQRDIIISELPNGRRLPTDGRHLIDALKKCGYKKADVSINYVESEKDAFELFKTFNTKGKTLSNLDYIVSYSNYDSECYNNENPYKKFLWNILFQ